MSLLSQSPASAPPLLARGRPLSGWRRSTKSALRFSHPIPPLFSSRRPPSLCPSSPKQKSAIFVVNPDAQNDADFSQETVPLEGVIQFEKPTSDFSAKLDKWGRVALFAGGDVLALLLFCAIGRVSHGLSVVDPDTFRTADPFIAGWFLSAYFLGGYGEDGRGTNGLTQAVIAAAKSWGLGIPLGIIIRAASLGHIPPVHFVLVTMGSTSVLLIGWRTLLLSIFPNDKRKKSDVYKRGSPFELFEVWSKMLQQCPEYAMYIALDKEVK